MSKESLVLPQTYNFQLTFLHLVPTDLSPTSAIRQIILREFRRCMLVDCHRRQQKKIYKGDYLKTLSTTVKGQGKTWRGCDVALSKNQECVQERTGGMCRSKSNIGLNRLKDTTKDQSWSSNWRPHDWSFGNRSLIDQLKRARVYVGTIQE